MSIDLDLMSPDELKALKAKVSETLSAVETQRKADALKALEAAAQEHGYTLDQLLAESRGVKMGGGYVSIPRYRNPADQRDTWCGRGRRPYWVKSHLAAGGSLEDLAI